LPSFWDSMHGLSYSKMSVNLFQTVHCHIPEDNVQSQIYYLQISVCVLCWYLYFLVVISTYLPYISLAFRSEGC